MEIKDTNRPTLTWSPKVINQLKSQVSHDTLSLFESNWKRLLHNTGFYMIPYCEDTIELMKSVHFWHEIIKEILECYTTDQVASRVKMPKQTLEALAEDDGNEQISVSLNDGEALLRLHQEICSEKS